MRTNRPRLAMADINRMKLIHSCRALPARIALDSGGTETDSGMVFITHDKDRHTQPSVQFCTVRYKYNHRLVKSRVFRH